MTQNESQDAPEHEPQEGAGRAWRESARSQSSHEPAGREREKLDGLEETSDALLGLVRRLRQAEERKRRTTISTPEFHALARQVEDQAREVWKTAAAERQQGEELDTQPGISTSDVERMNGDGA